MNNPETSLSFHVILPSLAGVNLKQVIKLAGRELSKVIGIQERILSDRLLEKEKQHTSAMGDGIAISHLHISGLHNPLHAFVRLKNEIDMKAPDHKPVDLMCILLTPEREGASYLRTLARLSRLLRNEQVCTKLRLAADEKSIRQILEQSSSMQIAA